MSLTAEQRRALAMLATAGRNGVPQALLSAHGFDASLIAGLVDEGVIATPQLIGADHSRPKAAPDRRNRPSRQTANCR
jgi:hypothetical protein